MAFYRVFIACGFWKSNSKSKKQTLIIIGDGSLQRTIQELGLAIREKLTPIIFVINNNGYSIERENHGSEKIYNDIPMWNYKKLPYVFGGNDGTVVRKKVETEIQLKKILQEARMDKSRLYWIEIILPKFDAPEKLKKIGQLFAQQNSKK